MAATGLTAFGNEGRAGRYRRWMSVSDRAVSKMRTSDRHPTNFPSVNVALLPTTSVESVVVIVRPWDWTSRPSTNSRAVLPS
jgi:hypothetical protein